MKKSITAKDTNYQAEQAKIAVASGGPVGVGLDAGAAEAVLSARSAYGHIYAVVGEEFGLFGSVAVLVGVRGDSLARHAGDRADPGRFRTVSGARHHDDAGGAGVLQYERRAGHVADERAFRCR